MNASERKHVLKGIVIVGGLYALVRHLNITGPDAHHAFQPWIVPAAVAIGLYGLIRLIGRR